MGHHLTRATSDVCDITEYQENQFIAHISIKKGVAKTYF
jgi:hypothetical protein